MSGHQGTLSKTLTWTNYSDSYDNKYDLNLNLDDDDEEAYECLINDCFLAQISKKGYSNRKVRWNYDQVGKAKRTKKYEKNITKNKMKKDCHKQLVTRNMNQKIPSDSLKSRIGSKNIKCSTKKHRQNERWIKTMNHNDDLEVLQYEMKEEKEIDDVSTYYTYYTPESYLYHDEGEWYYDDEDYFRNDSPFPLVLGDNTQNNVISRNSISSSECNICLMSWEDLVDGTELKRLYHCGSIVCKQCYEYWNKNVSNYICPCLRTNEDIGVMEEIEVDLSYEEEE